MGYLKEVFAGFAKKTKKVETHTNCEVNKNSDSGKSQPKIKKAYQCPVKCEGEKRYDTMGYCPDCIMHLIPIN